MCLRKDDDLHITVRLLQFGRVGTLLAHSDGVNPVIETNRIRHTRQVDKSVVVHWAGVTTEAYASECPAKKET